MCLRVKNYKPTLAQEDIVCYKVLTKDKDGRWFTPCMYTYVAPEIIDGKMMFWGCGDDMDISCADSLDEFRVAKGYVHCCDSKESAIELIKAWRISNSPLEIFECIIPKGTVYYKGSYYEGSISGYASKAVKFVKLLSY